MVVIAIVTQKNGETIPKVHFMKVISCSLFNGWYTLTKEGGALLFDNQDNASVIKLPQGITI